MDRPIAIVMQSGTRERLQLAAMLAAVGASTGVPVRVFVAMNALPCFRRADAVAAEAEGPAGRALAHTGPPPEQLVADAVALGDAQVFPCSLAMTLAGIGVDDLPAWFGPPMGLAAFLVEAADAQVWTF